MSATVRPLLLLVALTGWSVVAPAAEAAGAVKSHVLFMGTDVQLQQGGKFYKVQSVKGGSFIITVDGKEKRIPMQFTQVNLQLDYQLKLAETSVAVDGLKVERGYTAGSDPNRKFAAALAAAGQQSAISNASSEVRRLNLASHGGTYQANGPGPQVDVNGAYNAALNDLSKSTFDMNNDFNSAGHNASDLQQELAEENYDAVEISFEVAADKPLTDAYAVIVAQFAARGAKPNEVQNWVYATELDEITADHHRVFIKQGGFPPGFALKNSQLHVYNRGQEVATTVAPKRVELTRDEAFDYLLLDYLSSNKGKTLPATLAMGRLSADVRNRLPTPALYVKVSRDGLPLGTFADEACAHRVDDLALDAALRTLRFKPALKEGKPVEGVARLGAS